MNPLEELKDKITEVQTINVKNGEFLIVKVNSDDDVSDDNLLALKKAFPSISVILCNKNYEFLKVTQDEFELVDILKGRK